MLFGLRRKLGRCSAWLGFEGSSGRTGADAMVTATARRLRPGEAQASVTARPDTEVRIVLERTGSALLVSASGSVDASNVDVWRRLVVEAAAIAEGPGPLIVDTSGLEFMGVGAFAVLGEVSTRCRSRGISFCLVSSQPIAGRVVKATALDSELSFCTTVDEALGDTPRENPGPVEGSSA
jgi:anti-anti-sigma factor